MWWWGMAFAWLQTGAVDLDGSRTPSSEVNDIPIMHELITLSTCFSSVLRPAEETAIGAEHMADWLGETGVEKDY